METAPKETGWIERLVQGYGFITNKKQEMFFFTFGNVVSDKPPQFRAPVQFVPHRVKRTGERNFRATEVEVL
jgi:hypothetical protein